MNVQETLKHGFEQLLGEGRRVVANAGWDGSRYRQPPSQQDYSRFRTQALNLIRRSCGENSDHYKELKRLAEEPSTSRNSFYFADCIGVVEAAQRDFESGLLFDMRALIAAEVLGDFIEQSETLLKAGYFQAAASLAGAVLEDALRKLCEKHEIPLPEPTKLDRLNADLARENIYDKLAQKRITALADIRNNADHGHFDKFDQNDVEDMVKWIRRFSADFLR